MKAEEIKVIVAEFLEKMGFIGEVNVELGPEENAFVKVQSPDSKFLIGRNGEVLMDLQALLNKVARRRTTENIFIDLDVNDYKGQKAQFLKGLAKHYAQQVLGSGLTKEVDGFSAYERKVIHTELKKFAGVASESKGEEPRRILVIKPTQKI
ncbi:MAG: R3H domain-containing nucleic acid-binding protein [Candidatus Paceibacterota bacterium]